MYKKTVENMEHIHFKEKFTKKSVQADSININLRAVGWGKGGGAQKNLHHLHPLLKFSIFFYP